MKVICENIDRLVTTEMRLPYIQRGIIPALYAAARGEGEPIVYQIATAIKSMLAEGQPKLGLFTGFWSPQWMPKGENDGPLGAVALGKALHLAGAEVVYCVEKEVIPVMKKMCDHLGIPANMHALSREGAEYNIHLADELDGAIFIEKCGPSKEGIYHYATGPARTGEDAQLDTMVNRMHELGKIIIATGDVGNEIGFGKIYDEAREIVKPLGKKCKCPAGDGIITALAADYLLPAATSNLGAYGMAAALALVMENLDLMHQPDDELKFIEIAAEMECIDGGFGKPGMYVDGISAKAVVAQVEILKEMVSMYFKTEQRDF